MRALELEVDGGVVADEDGLDGEQEGEEHEDEEGEETGHGAGEAGADAVGFEGEAGEHGHPEEEEGGQEHADVEGGEDGQGDGAEEGGEGVERVVEEHEGHGQEEDEAVLEGAVFGQQLEVEAAVQRARRQRHQQEGVAQHQQVDRVARVGRVHEEVGVRHQLAQRRVHVQVHRQTDVGRVNRRNHHQVVRVAGRVARLTRHGHP